MKATDFDLFSTELLRLAKRLNELKNKKLAEHDIKVTNARCLCRIAASGEEGMSATQLSLACSIDKAQVSRCMLELTRKECVYRDTEEGKCYKQKYRLTEEGRRITNDLIVSTHAVREALGDGVADEEIDVFCSVLSRLCASLEKLEALNI